MSTNRNKGFSLLELMIVIAIIGTILAFALPSYEKQMLKSRRADAKTALVALAQLQETFNMNNANSYASDLLKAAADGGLNCQNKGLCKDAGGKALTPEGYYELSITDLKGGADDFVSGFVLTATIIADGAQGKDSCTSLSINSRGQKTSTPTGDCW